MMSLRKIRRRTQARMCATFYSQMRIELTAFGEALLIEIGDNSSPDAVEAALNRMIADGRLVTSW